jgi:hypothetical protein
MVVGGERNGYIAFRTPLGYPIVLLCRLLTGCTIREPSTCWWHEATVYEQPDAVQGWPRDLVNNQKPDQLKSRLKPKISSR